MYDLSNWYCLNFQSLSDDLLKFRSAYPGNCYSSQITITVKEAFVDLIQTVQLGYDLFGHAAPQVKCYDASTVSIIETESNTGRSVNMISIEDRHRHHNDLWKVYDRCITVVLHGELDFIERMVRHIKVNIKHDLVPYATWEFMDCDMRRSQDLQILPAKPIYPEFYPWIGDVYAYFNRYLASESSILVLLGESGTAKTSLVRSLIWHAQLTTMFTYDEHLLGSDSLFVDFIANNEADLLVIEDADLLLTDREHDGNKVMSKFLNVSDGLVSIGRKKIIFTANLTDPGRIDPAMLRPGRCFDCQLFRRLTYVESCAAAQVAGLPPPLVNRSYTLAEIFAADQRTTVRKTMGFEA